MKNFHLPHHHHLAPVSIFFLGHLHLCILFINQHPFYSPYHLSSPVPCHHLSPVITCLLSSLCLLSSICHHLVTCHRLVIIIFTFTSLPPLIIFGLGLYVSFSV